MAPWGRRNVLCPKRWSAYAVCVGSACPHETRSLFHVLSRTAAGTRGVLREREVPPWETEAEIAVAPGRRSVRKQFEGELLREGYLRPLLGLGGGQRATVGVASVRPRALRPLLSLGRRQGGWWWCWGCLVVFLSACAPRYVPPPPPPSPVVVPPSPVERLQAVALSWLGVPYRLGGMDRFGVDCSGLVVRLYAEAWGIEIPRRSVDQAVVGMAVPPDGRRGGDLVFFWDNGPHSGVLLDTERFIHASASRGVMISVLDAYWWPRLLAVRRLLSFP